MVFASRVSETTAHPPKRAIAVVSQSTSNVAQAAANAASRRAMRDENENASDSDLLFFPIPNPFVSPNEKASALAAAATAASSSTRAISRSSVSLREFSKALCVSLSATSTRWSEERRTRCTSDRAARSAVSTRFSIEKRKCVSSFSSPVLAGPETEGVAFILRFVFENGGVCGICGGGFFPDRGEPRVGDLASETCDGVSTAFFVSFFAATKARSIFFPSAPSSASAALFAHAPDAFAAANSRRTASSSAFTEAVATSASATAASRAAATSELKSLLAGDGFCVFCPFCGNAASFRSNKFFSFSKTTYRSFCTTIALTYSPTLPATCPVSNALRFAFSSSVCMESRSFLISSHRASAARSFSVSVSFSAWSPPRSSYLSASSFFKT
mmetsp:Transcript_11710/g.38945  ORF Transcript_11710/g.38945 Transcript_11710/m.38945 type:complete len:387 (+) Transcript_11710:260-1420(+)